MDASGRRALVTGGASGIGFETALALARAGADVIVADRNVAGGEAAVSRIRQQVEGGRDPAAPARSAPAPRAARAAPAIEFRALDLASLAGIRAFAAPLAASGAPALDLLVNVAGILPPPERATTADGFELKFGINHLGHFALTGALLPALLRSAAPRVVSVSSIVQARARIDFDDLQAERGYAPQRTYGQAKLACLMFALELDRRARAAGAPLLSVAAHPGIARTAIGDARRTQRHVRLQDWVEDWAMRGAMRFFGQDAAAGALPLVHAALAADAAGGEFWWPDGFGQFAGAPKRVAPSAAARDPAQRARLWQVSEQLTGVRYGW